MKTHRCKGSLAAHIPIRHTALLDWSDYPSAKKVWRLFNLRQDEEYLCIHFDHVAVIAYCPFCGEKLSEVEG